MSGSGPDAGRTLAGFRDRREAGQRLAEALSPWRGRPDALVLALPRGGVPVAYEVAIALQLPLDVFLVRKLGLPGHEEFAMGAIASGGIRLLNQALVRELRIPAAAIEAVTAREAQELARREAAFREQGPLPALAGKSLILIDDGLATGATMQVAVRALRQQRPARIAVAVPVAAAEACALFRDEADEVICLLQPEPFYAVGRWYGDFSQTEDAEVRELLRQAAARPGI